MTSNGIVQKLWNYCNVLRDDGLSYGDYLEQLTFLLFLKLAHEQTQPPYSRSHQSRKSSPGPRSRTRVATISKSTTATCWTRLATTPACSGSSSARPRTRSRIQPDSSI